jgi:transcriptional regulator of acetoin/glycerol metabolism
VAIQNVIEYQEIMAENQRLRGVAEDEDLIVGESLCVAQLRRQLAKVARSERDHIVRVLRAAHGNISRAAEILGIGRITIYKKLRQYGLEPTDFKRTT